MSDKRKGVIDPLDETVGVLSLSEESQKYLMLGLMHRKQSRPTVRDILELSEQNIMGLRGIGEIRYQEICNKVRGYLENNSIDAVFPNPFGIPDKELSVPLDGDPLAKVADKSEPFECNALLYEPIVEEHDYDFLEEDEPYDFELDD